MDDLEKFLIYRKYVDLVYYANNILIKYPKHERFALVNETKDVVYEGLKCIMYAQKEFSKTNRLKILNDLDVNLKLQKVFIRIAFKNKYISSQNYSAWSNKISEVGNLLGGWIKSCLS
jgi:hypothetical protein